MAVYIIIVIIIIFIIIKTIQSVQQYCSCNHFGSITSRSCAP
jgi:hypothetical protein